MFWGSESLRVLLHGKTDDDRNDALQKRTRIAGDSIGAMVEVVAVNPPALVGEPLYQSLKLRLMGALGGLHAAQSVEIGDGFAVVARRGSENNDPIREGGYARNSHGGLIGGWGAGSVMVVRRKMGYEGVIMTDDLDMGAIGKHFPIPVAMEQIARAGIDIALICHQGPAIEEAYRTLERSVAGDRQIRDIHLQCLQRIMLLKSRFLG